MHTGRSRRRPYRGIGSLVVLLALLGGLAPEVRGHVTTAVGAVACHAGDPASCTDPASGTPRVDPQQVAGLSPAQVADQLEGIVAPDEIAELLQLAADGDHDALTDHLAAVVGTVSTRAAGVVGDIARQV
ncbi:MAG TPA: hypothetical protein VMM13_20625, partial [Euzebya sp.]|nr:hypothetical protein [Euzebya sp.]